MNLDPNKIASEGTTNIDSRKIVEFANYVKECTNQILKKTDYMKTDGLDIDDTLFVISQNVDKLWEWKDPDDYGYSRSGDLKNDAKNTIDVIKSIKMCLFVMRPQLEKRVNKLEEQREIYVNLAEETGNIDYFSRAEEIVDDFMNFDPKDFNADSSKVTDFVSYLASCAYCKLDNMNRENNPVEYAAAKKQAKRLDYLEDKLLKATNQRNYTFMEKATNFLKKFGLLLISPFRGIEKMKEAGRNIKSPLETKRQAEFESSFSDLRKELDQIENAKSQNKTDPTIDL